MERHLISGQASIVEALEALNALSGETMVVFAVDGEGRLIGSLTDGDVRRALLSSHSLSTPVEAVCRRDCLVIPRGAHSPAAVAEARRRGITLIPVVDDGRIVALVDLKRRRGIVPADGVLMAGGRGERLRPLTEDTPKPLLPVGGRPIIDHNVELMRQFGIENIFVTVNYLKEQIIDHFKGDDAVECIAEPRRLGTIGSLSLIEDFRQPHIVVMNSDLLTDIDLEAMYLKHIDTEAWLTMAVIPYTVSVPFAIIEHTGDRVEGLTEKPTYNYFANAGIYMLRREIAQSLPKGQFMDATDLVGTLLREGRRVSLFNLEGRWLDIGSPDDYRHACELSLR